MALLMRGIRATLSAAIARVAMRDQNVISEEVTRATYFPTGRTARSPAMQSKNTDTQSGHFGGLIADAIVQTNAETRTRRVTVIISDLL
jgi:hypothetical protein